MRPGGSGTWSEGGEDVLGGRAQLSQPCGRKQGNFRLGGKETVPAHFRLLRIFPLLPLVRTTRSPNSVPEKIPSSVNQTAQLVNVR
jgi:hypothetical protein